jgi:hypothetical protein
MYRYVKQVVFPANFNTPGFSATKRWRENLGGNADAEAALDQEPLAGSLVES